MHIQILKIETQRKGWLALNADVYLVSTQHNSTEQEVGQVFVLKYAVAWPKRMRHRSKSKHVHDFWRGPRTSCNLTQGVPV
jgi:hypothetical protein